MTAEDTGDPSGIIPNHEPLTAEQAEAFRKKWNAAAGTEPHRGCEHELAELKAAGEEYRRLNHDGAVDAGG